MRSRAIWSWREWPRHAHTVQWAYSAQTASTKNLPFFFLKQIDVPIQQSRPRLQTADILTGDPTGSVGGAIMDHDFQVEYTQTWSVGIQTELMPQTIFEVFYMGSYTIGADKLDGADRDGYQPDPLAPGHQPLLGLLADVA